MEDILEFDLHSQHSFNLIGSGKTYGIGGLKVHNSASIERSEL
jgi:hypothetical protein